MVPKLFLRMGILAFSSFIFVSGIHAAPQVGYRRPNRDAERCWTILREVRLRFHALIRRYDHSQSATAATEGVRRWPDAASLITEGFLGDGALKLAHSGCPVRNRWGIV
jgi:hypothetical protein